MFGDYLMHFLPSLRVLSAQHCVIMQQRLHNLWIGFLGDGQVDSGEPFGVPIVGRCAQLQ